MLVTIAMSCSVMIPHSRKWKTAWTVIRWDVIAVGSKFKPFLHYAIVVSMGYSANDLIKKTTHEKKTFFCTFVGQHVTFHICTEYNLCDKKNILKAIMHHMIFLMPVLFWFSHCRLPSVRIKKKDKSNPTENFHQVIVQVKKCISAKRKLVHNCITLQSLQC